MTGNAVRQHDEGWLDTPAGLRLFRQGWTPEAGTRGVVVIVHGMAEHSGRYADVASFLAARGWAVEALDYRGHGRSPGGRVHVDDVDEYVTDVRAALAAAAARHPPGPRIVLGHSQGGLVTLRLALTAPQGVSAVVVTSPFLALHPASRPGAFRRAMARILLRIAPSLPVPTGVNPKWISRDPAVVASYLGDPLVSARASAAWLRAVTRAQQAVMAEAPRLTLPALVLSAGADRLADPEAARRFVDAAPAGRAEYELWDGLYHEILNEPERAQVYTLIADWLDAKFRRH